MELKFTTDTDAKADRDWWKLHGSPATKRKIQQLLAELEEHPSRRCRPWRSIIFVTPRKR